ncbi:hypothetical protein [Niallia circulans]
MKIAINKLLKKIPQIKLKEDLNTIEWRPGIIIRGAKEIPLTF